ncbi:MAG: acyltransferase family protein [Methylovirgula sp.]
MSGAKEAAHVYRSDIDGLRAVAVIPVVLYHADISMPGGFVGVDVFFVISGYLITKIIEEDLEARRFSLLNFYDGRIRRIFPALFVMFAILSVVAYLILPPLEHARFSDDLSSAAIFISNIHFFRQASYFDASAFSKPLLHTWSLGVEEQFYIFWPIFLLVFGASRTKRSKIAAISALIVASIALSQYWVTSYPNAAFYLLPARAWEFALGALLGLSDIRKVTARLPPSAAHILSVAGLIALGATYVRFNSATPFPGLAALPPCLAAAAILAAGEGGTSLGGRLLSVRPFIFFGRISYSLYLWHWPILIFSGLFLERPLTLTESCEAALASCLIAWVSWKIVEQPIRNWRPAIHASATRVAAGLAASGVFVALGLWGAASHGFWFRAPSLYRWSLEAKQEERDFQASPCMVRNAALPPVKGCLFGAAPEGSHYDAVLWGDSYAAHLVPVLNSLGRRFPLTFREITKAGCPPIVGMRFFPPDAMRAACSAFNAAALKALSEDKDVRLILLSARWDALASGALLATPDGTRTSSALSRRNVIASLRSTFDQLTRDNRRILLVGQIPVPGFDVVACMARTRFNHQAEALCATMPAAGPLAADTQVRQMLAAAVARHPNVSIAPVFDEFCQSQDCSLIHDGMQLYMDETHLSPKGAELIGPVLETRLHSLLAESPDRTQPGLTNGIDNREAQKGAPRP